MERLTLFALNLIALMVVFYTVFGSHGLLHFRELKSELRSIERTNTELEEKITFYQEELDALKRSDEALEKKAREELGLARENEVVYSFPPEAEGP